MKKILYCASTVSHLVNFHIPYLKGLQKMGYEVVAMANEALPIQGTDKVIAIPFAKKLTSMKNILAIWQVRRILIREKFDLISTHTTLASAIVRAAVLSLPRKNRPKVYCTSHGYLFNENDGFLKWKYLIPECICAKVTDLLMVMNQEDLRIAQRWNLSKGEIVLIPGMGVDFEKLDTSLTKEELREKFGFGKEDVLFVFAGEFSDRKNQKFLIEAFAKAKPDMPNAKLVLAGEGGLLEACKVLARNLNIAEDVLFLGHVDNIGELYHCCDICVSASKIEGLPFNIMEAMYCGLPCIMSDIKGHRDLIRNQITGELYSLNDMNGYYRELVNASHKRGNKDLVNKKFYACIQDYSLKNVNLVILKNYKE